MALSDVIKTGLWTGLASLVFVIVLLGAIYPVPLQPFLAAVGLIPVGGFVVAVLIKLSFDEDHAAEEH